METSPRWPVRLAELVERLSTAGELESRQSDRAEIWLLIRTALHQYLRRHAARMPAVDPSDIDDVASEKSMDLLSNAESGKWKVASREGAEVAAYLSTVARNALMDHLRGRSRQVLHDEESMEDVEGSRAGTHEAHGAHAPRPDALVESRDFTGALSACAEGLRPQALLVWFFRVFHDMPSKEIARHPEVNLKPGHVNVLLQRTRQAIADCMRQKGHDPSQMPPGTFTELWVHFRHYAEGRES